MYFFRITPLFWLKLVILYQAPHSQALAPTCCALVYPKGLAVKENHDSLDFILQTARMPLHWAASGGHADIVEFLLSLNVPVDARDEVCNFRYIIPRKSFAIVLGVHRSHLVCPSTLLVSLFTFQSIGL